MVVSFYNIDVTKVAGFSSSVNAMTLGEVVGAEEERDRNTITNDIPKAPIDCIYTNHDLVTSLNYSKMIT